MKIAAHRGTAIHAPENSRQALISSYTAGADVLQLEVQLTKDDRLVISHDASIERLTGESGRIPEMTLRELRHTAGRYDFSARFNPYGVAGFSYYRPGRRLQIESFETMLDLLPRDVPKLIALEHGSSPDAARRDVFVRKTMEALADRGLLEDVVVYSADKESLKLARQLDSQVPIAAFGPQLAPGEQLALIAELGADGLVTDLDKIVSPAGELTEMGGQMEGLFEQRKLRVGAVLVPGRSPGVFTETEYKAVCDRPFVWALLTDSMLGAEVDGSWVDVPGLLGGQWTWLEERFAGQRVDRDLWALGYAKGHRRPEDNARVYQQDGIHVEAREYTGWLPPETPSVDETVARVEHLEARILYAEKTWPYYTGGGVGLVPGIHGDFIAEVDYQLRQPLSQASTLEMAVVNADPGSHRADPPESFRHKDCFFDPHGAPPFVGVEHDENDGYRINCNLGSEYDNNRYGPPVGDGKSPRGARLRLERRGAYFAAYYRNEVDAPDWICVGATRNQSLNEVVYLRCAAKRWRQEKADDPSEYWPVVANTVTFKNLTIKRWRAR